MLPTTSSAQSVFDVIPQRDAAGGETCRRSRAACRRPPRLCRAGRGIRSLDASVRSASSTSSADTSARGSAGDVPPALEGAPDDGNSAKALPLPASVPAMEPLSAQLGGAGSSLGWIFRCVITTKAGRCVVNRAPHASADGVRAGQGSNLAVGLLCPLLVTMHEFSQGGFLSYVQIQNFGMVLVDGGSYLVGVVCATGVDLPAAKLRAVQLRHVFGLLPRQQVDEMQGCHEAEAEAKLKSYTIHSSRTERGERGCQIRTRNATTLVLITNRFPCHYSTSLSHGPRVCRIRASWWCQRLSRYM